jgi:uncharacterized protein YegP (UPF0339 family)
MAADFEVRKDDKGEWYWIFQADNGEPIAKSSESYINRSDCLHSIKIVKEKTPDAPVWDMTKVELVGKLP